MPGRREVNDRKPLMTKRNARLGIGPGAFIIRPAMPQRSRHSPRGCFHFFATGVRVSREKPSNSAHQELALAEPACRMDIVERDAVSGAVSMNSQCHISSIKSAHSSAE